MHISKGDITAISYFEENNDCYFRRLFDVHCIHPPPVSLVVYQSSTNTMRTVCIFDLDIIGPREVSAAAIWRKLDEDGEKEGEEKEELPKKLNSIRA